MSKINSSGGSSSRWPSGQASTSRWPSSQSSTSRWIYGGSSGSAHWRSYPAAGGGGAAASVLALDLPWNSSIDNLNTSTITIGSAVLGANFVYQAKNASDLTGSGSWTPSQGATTLVYGAGSNNSTQRETFTSDANDKHLTFVLGNKRWTSGADTSIGNVGTDDFVIERLVNRTIRSGGTDFTGGCGHKKLTNTAGDAGWLWQGSIAIPSRFIVSDGSTMVNRAMWPALGPVPWHWTLDHVICDRSLNIRYGFNGTLSATLDSTLPSGSYSNSQPLILGHGTSNAWEGDIAHMALYTLAPGTLDNSDTTALTNFLQARLRLLLGLDAATALGDGTPQVWDRNSYRHIEKTMSDDSRKLFAIPQKWFLAANQQDDGNYIEVEAQATNLFTQNYNIADAAWTKVGSPAVSGWSAPPMDTRANTREFRGITAPSGTAQVGVHQSPTLTAADHVLAFYITPGNKTWWMLENATIANGRCWFDLTGSGAVGTQEAGIEFAHVYKLSATMWRIQMRFIGTAAAHQLGCFPCDADNNNQVTGDGSTVNGYAGYGQCEAGQRASSLIFTEGATATRLDDDLMYDVASHWPADSTTGVATLQASIVLHADDDASARTVVSLSDGTTTNQAIHRINASFQDNMTVTDGGASQVNITGSTARNDNAPHDIVAKYKQNDFGLWVDAASIGTDTSGTFDNDSVYTELQLGANESQAEHLEGHVGNVKIYLSDETGGLP